VFTPVNLSVQLYTVRDAVRADLDAALARIAGFGYRQVEPFGLLEFADQLAIALPRHGLSAPTTHTALLGNDEDANFAAAKALGVQVVIDPYITQPHWTTEDSIKRTAEALNLAAHKAQQYELTVGYHNHQWELEEKIDGRHALEVLVDHLTPEVVLEVDTYWAAAGGADVPALLQRLGDRVVALHIKDGDGSLDLKKQVAVGAGSMPVWDFVNAATNLRLGVVELDDSAGDLFQAIQDSFRYLTERT
jgi:sugar phosphate isomerase/epimerase